MAVSFSGLQERGRTSDETARLQLHLLASLWPHNHLPCAHHLQDHARGQGQFTPTPAREGWSTSEFAAVRISAETVVQLSV